MQNQEPLYTHTVGGRNPAPGDIINMVNIHYVQGFMHPRGAGFLPSTLHCTLNESCAFLCVKSTLGKGRPPH